MSTATTISALYALDNADGVPDPEISEKAKRRQFTAQYKLDIVAEYDGLSEPGQGRDGTGCTRRTSWSGAEPATPALSPSCAKPRGRKRRLSAQGVELERVRRRNERLEAELAKARLDFLLSPAPVEACRDLLEVIEDRAERRATSVASQLPVKKWYAAMADPTLAEAVPDRLCAASPRIAMKGPAQRRRQPGPLDEESE